MPANGPCCQDAVGTLKNRLQKGLDALGAAAYAVANMQSEPGAQHCLHLLIQDLSDFFHLKSQRLEAKQPVLEETKVKAGGHVGGQDPLDNASCHCGASRWLK